LFCLVWLWTLSAWGAPNEKAAKHSQSFSHPIRPAGESATGDTQALQAILDAGKDAFKSVSGNAKQKQRAHQEAVETEIARWEQFVGERPASVWSPSLRVNLGKHYRQKGRYSEALRHWEEAWQATKHFKDGEGKMIADEALAHWTRILASLGRFETLTEVLNETKGRVLDRGPLSQMFSRTQEGYAGMIKRSGLAYKCGVYALHNVATILKGRAS
jgi:tetratricopeptide (TPR) repeat protein